jgi:hypothetical protein
MNFKLFLLLHEASYAGNIGIMEMVKFHRTATAEQKAELARLIQAGKQEQAWEFLQSVTGVKLQKEDKTDLVPKKIPDGYNEGKWTWAVVRPGTYGDDVVESGFSTKRDALAWIARSK